MEANASPAGTSYPCGLRTHGRAFCHDCFGSFSSVLGLRTCPAQVGNLKKPEDLPLASLAA